ncbi:hypothetical protein [Acetobacter malorum]|nr:hypothetical protein [Acetobacter malorum]
MEVWLQTRGVTHDYAFLGVAPPDYWWTAPLYKDATSFEQPTLILERLPGGQWCCFISAIPSSRRDRVNTRIRYSMALSGNVESDQRVLLNLLAYVLDIFKNNPVSEDNLLTRLLDEEVGAHADEWLGGNQEQAKIHINGLKQIFVDLKSYSVEPQKLREEFLGLLSNAPSSPSVAAMLNFIGRRKEPSAEQLQSQVERSQKKILILPSPIAGGQLAKYFILTPSTESGNRNSFLLGSQRDNPTTESPDTTRQSTLVRNDKPKSIADFHDKQMMIAVIIVVVEFLTIGWYMLAN